jgi:hypothetical protein
MSFRIESTAQALPWQRLPGERARDYYTFCIYRNLGVDRSLQQAWRAYCSSEQYGRRKLCGRPHVNGAVTKCPGAWTDLSRRYDWACRARAYDKWVYAEQEDGCFIADEELGCAPAMANDPTH